MKITITINCDNAAFGDDPGPEAGRILARVAREFAAYGVDKLPPGNLKTLRDINGNTVGKVEVTK